MSINKSIPNNTYNLDILDFIGPISYFYNYNTLSQAKAYKLYVHM